jgi:hypothetical protein
VDNANGGDRAFVARLREDCGTPATVDTAVVYLRQNAAAGVLDMGTADLGYLKRNPQPGTACTYTLEGVGENDVIGRNDVEGDMPDTGGTPELGFTWIEATAEPGW